jgi:hypothetical protein
MKAGKIIGGVVLAAVAVIAVVAFLGLQNLDQIIKVAIETAGPRVTGTAVTLDSVKLEVTNGRGELHGLQIDNPKGYNSEYAFYLGEVALQVDPKSLAGDVIVVKEVLVDGAKLIAEQKDLKQFNLQDLMDNMSQGSTKPVDSEESAKASEGSNVRIIIEKISFVNNDARLISSQWGEKTLKIPDINLSNIGKKENGLSPEQLGPAILQPLLKQTKQAVKKELEALARKEAENKLNEKMDEKLNDEQKEQVKGLKKLFN